MLTKKQHMLLSYIKNYIEENGFSPTFEEMKEHQSLKSKSSISNLLKELEKKEYITMLPLQKRAIIIRKKETYQVQEDENNLKFLPVYAKNLNTLKTSFPIASFVLDPKKQYFGLTEHDFIYKNLNIKPNDFLIFEKTNQAQDKDIFLFYDNKQKIELDFYSKNDIRKPIGILKIKMESYV